MECSNDTLPRKQMMSFADRLYNEVLTCVEGDYPNVLVSPMSIYSALAIVLAGSNGDTRSELMSALQLPEGVREVPLHKHIGQTVRECFESKPGVTVSVANRLFVKPSTIIEDDFAALVSESYDACAEKVYYESSPEGARLRINQWVSKRTNNKIQDLFPPGSFDSKTVATLVNALYFKGVWEKKFDKRLTREDDFFLLDGQKKKVMRMYQQDYFESTDLPEFDATALRIPFRDTKWSMLILLPRRNDGLKTLGAKMKLRGLQLITGAMYNRQKTNLFLPRFKLHECAPLNMKAVLMKMGVNKVFSPNSADLGALCKNEELFVSAFLHKAIMEVDEEGATAVAVTAATYSNSHPVHKEPEVDFRVDHPFVVVIMYDDVLPVFMGQVADPGC